MAEQLAEVQAIVRKRDFPIFENTFEPLERSGQLLERVSHVFFNKSSADSNDFTNELEEKLAPSSRRIATRSCSTASSTGG